MSFQEVYFIVDTFFNSANRSGSKLARIDLVCIFCMFQVFCKFCTCSSCWNVLPRRDFQLVMHLQMNIITDRRPLTADDRKQQKHDQSTRIIT
jgi:hypothetical protein